MCCVADVIPGVNGFTSSDIDLFVWGLDPPAAFRKLQYVLDHVRLKTGGQGDVLVRGVALLCSAAIRPIAVWCSLTRSPCRSRVCCAGVSALGDAAGLLPAPSLADRAALLPLARSVTHGPVCWPRMIPSMWCAAEVLIGFDIDCCCVGYNGDKVLLPFACLRDPWAPDSVEVLVDRRCLRCPAPGERWRTA